MSTFFTLFLLYRILSSHALTIPFEKDTRLFSRQNVCMRHDGIEMTLICNQKYLSTNVVENKSEQFELL